MVRQTVKTIGYRAYEEVMRLSRMRGIDLKEFCERYGFYRTCVYNWYHGKSPSAEKLAKLNSIGADIKYILIGERLI